jgi:hypothetical protein
MHAETQEPILQFFHYDHLPPPLQTILSPFCDMAYALVANLPRNPERTIALRKLLEAKEAAMRAKFLSDSFPALDVLTPL